MKLKLLFAFVAVSLMSCASDDGVAPVNPADSAVGTNLKEIKNFYDGELRELLKFENDKLKERYLYNGGELFFEDIYTYNTSGLLIGRDIHSFPSGEPDQTLEQVITYDNMSRIKSIYHEVWEGGSMAYGQDREFNYTNPNKIVETEMFSGSVSSPSYYDLNSEGLVYKLTAGIQEDVNEVIFLNGNVATHTSTWENDGNVVTAVTSYSYDMQTVVKGDYINIYNNQFGAVKSNAAIYYSRTSANNANYVSQSIGENNNYTFQYLFSSNGYPVNVKRLNPDGSVYSESVIIYQ